MSFYRKKRTQALTVLMAGIRHMVEVYNSMVKDDHKIKIIVLPNNQDGKDIYDHAYELFGEDIE